MPKNEELITLPKMNPQIQGTQNVEDEVAIIDLSGQWYPSKDSTEIGKDFLTMTNMRYTGKHPIGIGGMIKSNQAALSAYPKVRSAINFRKETPAENHILVQAYNAAVTQGVVLDNQNFSPTTPVMIFSANDSSLGPYISSRSFSIASGAAPPVTHTIEIKAKFDSLGTYANTDYAYLSYFDTGWRLGVFFASDGLYIQKDSAGVSEVETDIVKCNSEAEWQTFRIEVHYDAIATAHCTVWLNGVKQGATFDCGYATGGARGLLTYTQYGNTTNGMKSKVEYIKVATGNGVIT
jgi:hypothetical protein